MERRNAILADGVAVLARGITGIAVPTVLGIKRSLLLHEVVTAGFGQDGRGRNGEVLAIALHDGLMGYVAVGFEAVAVHNHEGRTHRQLVEGPVHGQDGGVEDIDFVNFLVRYRRYGPGHGIRLNDLAQGIAAMGRQLLAVVEPLVVIVGRQDDGRRKHRTGQTTATGFVASGLGLNFAEMG